MAGRPMRRRIPPQFTAEELKEERHKALMSAIAEQSKPIEKTHKVGAFRAFSEEVGAHIINGLMDGLSLRAISRELGIPQPTLNRWTSEVAEPVPGFASQVARARISQAHVWAEATVDIADRLGETTPDSLQEVARDRIRIDARRWIVGKLLPRVYGDRVMQEITGQVEVSVGVPDTRELAKALLMALSGRGAPPQVEHQVEDIELEALPAPHIEHARARGRPRKAPKAKEPAGSSLFDRWLKDK